MRKIVSDFDNEWSADILHEVYDTIEKIAVGEWGYDIYPNQIEIISSDGMLEAYASNGLPVMYHHWSYGKRYLSQSKYYKAGLMGLAYEIVINSNPCISYLMEGNTLVMQTLVMAHACFGHNCFANDTEVLTANGWRGREDVREGDSIATLNRETRLIEYHPVQKKFEYDYDGQMCHFKNSSADHLVTPNHKMVYWSEASQQVKESDALEWTKTGTYELVSGKLVDVKDNADYSDEELRLLVWCITDGSLEYEPTGYWRFHLKKKRKINRLINLLDDLGLDFRCTPTNRGNVKIAVNLDIRYRKNLSSNFSLSPRQFEVFILEWLQTDGSLQTKVSKCHERSGSLFTNNKNHVDKIQELAVYSGAKSSYRVDDNGVYTINIRLGVEVIKLTHSPLTGLVDYKGKVWCVEVENHTVIARRNGRVLITGNSFFKNNYLFKQWTQPEAIIDYLGYAKRYISRCEDRYGIDAVEEILDAAHAISHYSVDKYHRVKKTKGQLEEELRRRIEWEDSQYDPLVRPFRMEKKPANIEEAKVEPTENLLYFIEKQAPNLHEWQREIIRIVRKVGQYFYPQGQTQVMNEGFATATHYEMSWELYNRGYVDDAFIGEFIDKHSGVLYSQPTAPGSPLKYLNPYKLGFEMYMDIKRRCQNPTKEDDYYFPEQVGRPYRDVWFEAVNAYKDESFIEQYLSPEVARKMQLISIFDSDKLPEYKVSGTASDESFNHIRKYLSRQYDFGSRFPQISIHDVDWKGNRRLHLRHDMQNRRPLDSAEAKKVLTQVHKLWQFPVSLDSHDDTGSKNYQVYPT